MDSAKQAKIVSALAIILAAAHVALPGVKLDSTTVALLVIAAIPWLAPYIRSLEVPGLKIDFQDLEKVEREAFEAGLLETVPEVSELPAYLSVSKEDPNLTLAGLRIEIEKRLKAMADARGLESERTGIGRLLRSLWKEGSLSEREYSALRELVSILNRAVHGAEVDFRSAQWAIDVGAGILAALDQRLAKTE